MPGTSFSPIQRLDEYDSLVSRLKQMQPQDGSHLAPAIAVVSYDSGAGVTSVTSAIADRMNSSSKVARMSDVTISLSPDELARTTDSATDFVARLCEQHVSALELVFADTEEDPASKAQDIPDSANSFERRFSIARSLFRFVLVECSPLQRSSDIATVAPLVDGVLVIVEANRTTHSQIERASRTIENAGGHVLGYVLNKQTFPIPSSIYNICEKLGVV